MNNSILIVVDKNNKEFANYQLNELRNLAISSGFNIVYETIVKIKRIVPSTYIGKGKIEELTILVKNLEANIIIFNNELTGSQWKNIEDKTNCSILDRTALILNIFAEKAKTKTAMIQVKMAQLNYFLPRLVGLRESLWNQQGGSGFRGPGETKLELDRRKIIKERTNLRKELQLIAKTRKQQKKKRQQSTIPNIAIVGYTNAGKSTLMNVLLDHHKTGNTKFVLEEDKLFATLDTATRKIQLTPYHTCLVTDTVGFVSNLPHHLIESFKSTLEEVIDADYLIHVVDSSNPFHEQQIQTTNNILNEIGALNIPMIYIYNKTDLIRENITNTHFPSINASLKHMDDKQKVISFITEHIFPKRIHIVLKIPIKKNNIISAVNRNFEIIKVSYDYNYAFIEILSTPDDLLKYRDYIIIN